MQVSAHMCFTHMPDVHTHAETHTRMHMPGKSVV